MKAEELAKPIIGAPSAFSEVIRSLLLDYGRGNFKYSANSKFLASRLIKAPSVHVPLYFACREFLDLGDIDALEVEEILQLNKPFTLSSLLVNLYMFRKAKRVCPDDEWPFIYEMYLEQMEVGGYFGQAIPDVGLGFGLLVGGLRPLSMVAFALSDEKGFKKYRRSLKAKPYLYDREQEIQIFGTSHVDVCSVFLQKLGFGAHMAKAFLEALQDAVLDEDEISGDFARFSASCTWIDSLVLTANIPSFEEDDPDRDEAAITRLLSQVNKLKNEGKESIWTDKNPDDYPHPEKLYKVKPKKAKATKIIETSGEIKPPETPEIEDEDEIPEDIAREFGLIK
jgi:hypothetical protein